MDGVFLKLLTMSAGASWLILAVLLVRFLFKKAPKRFLCLLWALAAVRLVCPFTLESDFSLLPERQDTAVTEWADAYNGETQMIFDTEEGYSEALVAGREPVIADGGVYVVTARDGISEPPTRGNTWGMALASLWLAGMAALLGYAVVRVLRLRRNLCAGMPVGDGVWICDGLESPCILGMLNPRIYLPSDLEEAQVPFVLAHERAHLRSGDHWWKPLGFVLLAVHWFNPLVWVAYVLFCRDIELACDARVIKDLDFSEKKAYAAALLACSVPQRRVAACPLAFGEVGVKERVKSVLNYKKPALWIAVLAVVACLVVAVCFLTTPKTMDEDRLSEVFTTLMLREETPVSLSLNQGKENMGTYDGWGCNNDWRCFSYLSQYTYEVIPSREMERTDQKITLSWDEEDWSIEFYNDTDFITLHIGRQSQCFRALTDHKRQESPGKVARRWYDEAELQALFERGAETVIPNTGQDYLMAAQAYCEEVWSAYQKIAPDSTLCCSSVSCRTRPADTTPGLRQQGVLEKNGYAFFVDLRYVPENDGTQKGLAFGYITLKDDGWHGTLSVDEKTIAMDEYSVILPGTMTAQEEENGTLTLFRNGMKVGGVAIYPFENPERLDSPGAGPPPKEYEETFQELLDLVGPGGQVSYMFGGSAELNDVTLSIFQEPEEGKPEPIQEIWHQFYFRDGKLYDFFWQNGMVQIAEEDILRNGFKLTP